MAVWEDLETVEANETLSPEQKKLERFRLKAEALWNVMANSPVFKSGRPFTHEGIEYRVFIASLTTILGVTQLRIRLRATRTSDEVVLLSEADEIVLINPPVYGPNGELDLSLATLLNLRNMLIS
jgi:hypothetical protein